MEGRPSSSSGGGAASVQKQLTGGSARSAASVQKQPTSGSARQSLKIDGVAPRRQDTREKQVPIGKPSEPRSSGLEDPVTPLRSTRPSAVVRTLKTVRGGAHATVMGAINFTMGASWLALTNVIIAETFSVDPAAASAAELWCCATVVTLVLLPVMSFLSRRIAELEHRANKLEQMAAAGNLDFEGGSEVAVYKNRVAARNLQTLSSWGCAFAMAAQLNQAVAGSLPMSPWYWRAAYAVLLMLAVVCISALVLSAGRNCCGHGNELEHQSVAETLTSGSAYAVALAFLDAAVAAFELNDIADSEELGYLVQFTAATVAIASVLLAISTCFDQCKVREAAAEAADRGYREDADSLPPALSLVQVGTSMRKLAAKTVSMCAVLSMHALLYVALARFSTGGGHTSVYEPLPIESALLLLGVSVVATVVLGGVISCCLRNAAERLSKVDRDRVPGPFDDLLLTSLQALAQTTAATLLEAFAWLVGIALHTVAGSLWDISIDAGELSTTSKFGAAVGYAVLTTGIAVCSAHYCRLVPLQGA